jgi:sugar phosphate isomerase/epimerase
MDRARLSLNQYTVKPWSLREAIDGCVRHGVPAISVWRDKLAEHGAAAAAHDLRAAGLRVASLCRGGLFPAGSAAERQARIDDNLSAIDEAASIGAPVLVLVPGPAQGASLADARAQIAAGIAAILPHAQACNVRLAIEPLHPMMIAERSVITSLAEANDLCASFACAHVGVIVDVYHVFWDYRVEAEIARAGTTIAGFHLSDWRTPSGDLSSNRAMIGDGCIDLAGLARAVYAAGFTGDAEIEVLNTALWAGDQEMTLRTAVERYLAIPFSS